MELRHLRHFVAVAEELHFARAAERVGMEQSPLSHSIRNLEADLGAKLFHRTTRRTWLTRAGARFYPQAVRILEAVEHARTMVRQEAYEAPGRLAIGLAEHAAGEPFTRFFFELEHGEPPIIVDLREIGPGDAVRLVSDMVLDLAVVLQQIEAPGLRTTRAWSDPLVLVAPLGHPAAERDRISLDEVASEPFVVPDAATSPGYAAQIGMLLTRHGNPPTSRHPVKHQNTMVSIAASGRGLALMAESIAHGLTSVAVVPLAQGDAKIVSWLLHRKEDASAGVSSALEVATVISAGARLSAPPRA